MTKLVYISQLDGGSSRLNEAQQWRDLTLLPHVSAVEGAQTSHVYCAFNSPQVALVAQLSDEAGARAAAADGVIDNEGGLFAVALLLGLIFIGIGGFSLLPPRDHRRPRH